MDPQIVGKLEETEFFLGEMEKAFQDDIRFKFMYSAFLGAGQSTLYYLVSRYKDRLGFNDWYWGKKAGKGIRAGGRIEIPEIKHLMNARGSIVHIEPVPQGATREISFTVNCLIVDPRAPKEQVDASKPAEHVEENSPTTVVRWLINEDSYMRYEKHGNIIDDIKYIPDLKKRYSAEPAGPKNIDILKLSKGEVEEVRKLLAECEGLFP